MEVVMDTMSPYTRRAGVWYAFLITLGVATSFDMPQNPPSNYSVLLYVIDQFVATSNLGSMAEDEHRPNKDRLRYKPGESVP
jgi:hypothetical protein